MFIRSFVRLPVHLFKLKKKLRIAFFFFILFVFCLSLSLCIFYVYTWNCLYTAKYHIVCALCVCFFLVSFPLIPQPTNQPTSTEQTFSKKVLIVFNVSLSSRSVFNHSFSLLSHPLCYRSLIRWTIFPLNEMDDFVMCSFLSSMLYSNNITWFHA